MKTGFCVFLASLAALGASWLGLVYAPLQQLGSAKETAILQSSYQWPQQRTGDATLGLQVYRANGCAACHTEQIRQTGVASEISLTGIGTNDAKEVVKFITSLMIVPELINSSNAIVGQLANWDGSLPKVLYAGDESIVADTLGDKLKAGGLKHEARIVASGPDITRGWGVRQSVAADYLFDIPVQLGSLRAGPDLSNIGVRSPDVNWQLLHLYAPRALVKNSTMPAFRHLFHMRKIGAKPSPEALVLRPEFAPPAGFEVVPTAEARQLAAYLVALKANVPLYEAPFTPPPQPKQ